MVLFACNADEETIPNGPDSGSIEIEWQKTFGGSDDDVPYSIQHTEDGGYIIVGRAGSSDGDVGEKQSDEDAWVLKINSIGNIE